MEIITRAQARSNGLKRYFVDRRCPKGHLAQRLVSNATCCVCVAKKARAWELARPEHKRQRSLEWHRRPTSKAKHRRYTRTRRATQLLRTPAWADFKEIDKVYVEAVRLTTATGIVHEVDHVIPLRGKLVSGLHVHANLQVVTRNVNRRKGHTYVP